MAAMDHGQMKCEMMNMDGSMDHDMSGCECPEQCKVNCTSVHMNLAINVAIQMLRVDSTEKLVSRSFSMVGTDQIIELRPPKKFHA